MAKKIIEIKEKELIDRILSGEKDFTGISIKYLDIRKNERYGELFQYMEENNSHYEPILFNNSILCNFNIYKIDLDCLQAENAQFHGCKFDFSSLVQSNFSNSRLYDVSFSNSYMPHSDFSGSYIRNVDFSNANLSQSEFYNAIIESAQFIDSKLRKAKLDFEAKGKTDFTRANLSQSIMGNINSNYFGLESAVMKNTFVENLAEWLEYRTKNEK